MRTITGRFESLSKLGRNGEIDSPRARRTYKRRTARKARRSAERTIRKEWLSWVKESI